MVSVTRDLSLVPLGQVGQVTSASEVERGHRWALPTQVAIVFGARDHHSQVSGSGPPRWSTLTNNTLPLCRSRCRLAPCRLPRRRGCCRRGSGTTRCLSTSSGRVVGRNGCSSGKAPVPPATHGADAVSGSKLISPLASPGGRGFPARSHSSKQAAPGNADAQHRSYHRGLHRCASLSSAKRVRDRGLWRHWGKRSTAPRCPKRTVTIAILGLFLKATRAGGIRDAGRNYLLG